MDSQLIEKSIRELITKTPHLSLATVSEGRPWVCEVHFAYDDELNLYFVSKLTTRHCQEITSNPHVAGNIIKQHPLTEAPNGLYFEGMAEEIIPSEADIARYCTALGRDIIQLKEQLLEPNGRRMFRIKVSNWAVFGNIDGSGHVKHELNWGEQ
jgi:uncharacterized protein YhbP (UPF0306 family)